MDPPPDEASSLDETLKSLKRKYLSLLPQEQIIEICLAFEHHIPLHIRDTIWPADLEVAILTLKKGSQSADDGLLTIDPEPSPVLQGVDVPNVPSHLGQSPPQYANGNGVPPMGSLMDDSAANTSSAEKSSSKQDPDPVTSGSSPPKSSTATQPSTEHGSHSPNVPASHSSTPQPQPLAPYPYAPYGYTPPNQPQQPAYPHTPYYTPPPHHHAYASPYPYAGYHHHSAYAQPSTGHLHSHYPPAPHSRASPSHHPPMPGPSAPSPAPPPPPTDDLPSYEEMIVEALMETADPEGAAPKDLFAWMASRYPVQTNFRPSASQALQKAYKRGRLEKRAGGRYRLNPAWEGGATSKRTTRKPQTLAQTTYAMHHAPQPPSSPFTTAPLQHHHHHQQHTQYPQSGQQPHPGYPYGYPPSNYPAYGALGYPPYLPPTEKSTSQAQASKTTPATATAAPASASTSASVALPATKEGEKDGLEDAHDASAWEAAQHILEAINFGSFGLQAADSAPGAPPTVDGGASAAMSHPPPLIASTGIDLSATISESSVDVRTTLTDEERASLQAQLALLAAQLVEIADAEDDVDDDWGKPAPVLQSADVSGISGAAERAPGIMEKGKDVTRNDNQLDGNVTDERQLEQAVAMMVDGIVEVAAASLGAGDDEESDEDEDMEMVEVPTYAEALRT